ncbi:alpha/beta hydrolase [Nocardia cyriacigeorgica]|uniref:Alpha/beta hydrolase n=1 Tax=Nocardia cyriacigeorgica TaxID=135487 RepID=A0ABX0CRU7_9NOCA|nr:alpha/beta hydrolase [Nocardia cyriacigeorgica]NEW58113.1 alpha/beta hydrolase [Nocardia cyriacigeorgica]
MTTDRIEPVTSPSPIALRDITVDGAGLHYAEAGTGDPLVLLHGWPESHLACHDYGGFLGLGFVQRYPERVRRFALLNSRAHRTFIPPYYLLFGMFTVAARHRVTRPLLAAAPIYWVHRWGMAGYLRNGTFDSARLDRYLQMLRTPEGRRWYAHFWAGYQVRERPELAVRLAEITCPTTIIWGVRDPAIPITTAEQLARDIDGAELVRINADHFLMEQCPEQVTEALRRWLHRPAR